MSSDENEDLQNKIKAVRQQYPEDKSYQLGVSDAGLIYVEEITRLRIDLKNSKFLRYLNATRNEIARFDQYAYATFPKFQYNNEDLNYFAEHHTYDELKEEQRRLRWLHILDHSMEDSVRVLRNKIAGKFTYSEYSELIARAYCLVSKEIHTLVYEVTFGGDYCPKVTADKRVISCINFIMEEVELDVGEMVPRAKKPKLDPGTSS